MTDAPQWLQRVWAESEELPEWLKKVVGHPDFSQLQRAREGEGESATWWVIDRHEYGVAGDSLKEACEKYAAHYGL